MIVFICVDDRMGMCFNNRRQSRDSAVLKKITEMTSGKNLYMNGYSSKLFEDFEIKTSENYLDETEENDFCFVETDDVSPYITSVEKIVLFKWNKVYPSDKKLGVDFGSWRLVSTEDFEGTSHERITCEVWER